MSCDGPFNIRKVSAFYNFWGNSKKIEKKKLSAKKGTYVHILGKDVCIRSNALIGVD